MTDIKIIPGPPHDQECSNEQANSLNQNQTIQENNPQSHSPTRHKFMRDGNQEIHSEIPSERILVWRCNCGAEIDRFCKEYTDHIKKGKAAGEEHKWQLVDKGTGEVVASSMREASIQGLRATRFDGSPQLGGGSSPKKKDKEKAEEDDSTPWKPRSPLVAKWVAATDELPAELLLLYKLFCDKCIAAGMMPPTRGEWITQSISQFYLEHADDFDLRGMAAEFISKVAGGQNEQGN